MLFNLSPFARSVIETSLGYKWQNPDTNEIFIGYIDNNNVAQFLTRPESGAVLIDTICNKSYFCSEFHKNDLAIYVGNLWLVHRTASLYRYSEGSKDDFGRSADSAPEAIAANFPCLFKIVSRQPEDNPDGIMGNLRYRAVMQSRLNPNQGDILIDQDGDSFLVAGVSNIDTKGLISVYLVDAG